METKGLFIFEINVLIGSLSFIRIPMLWVYGHYEYLGPNWGSTLDDKRQILTSKVGSRAEMFIVEPATPIF